MGCLDPKPKLDNGIPGDYIEFVLNELRLSVMRTENRFMNQWHETSTMDGKEGGGSWTTRAAGGR